MIKAIITRGLAVAGTVKFLPTSGLALGAAPVVTPFIIVTSSGTGDIVTGTGGVG